MLAGLLDAGFASLATFGIGIYAVRVLSADALGAYALAYQALFLVQLIPANLVFVPAEVAVTAFPEAKRLDHLSRSVALGILPALAAAVLVPLWTLVAPPEVPGAVVGAFTVTATFTAFLSPVQDHVRRILHSGGASWMAAAVSVTQLLTAAASLLVLTLLGVHPAWIPFAALGAANLVSTTVGLAAARRLHRGTVASSDRLRFAALADAGRWLLGGALLAPGTGFAVAAIVSRLAGAAALGYAEAARVLAQPIWVLAVGLSAVLGPRLMEAGGRGDLARARSISRRFGLAVAAASAAALVAFGGAWPWNPLAWLLPRAYVVPGLVAVTIGAQVANSVSFPIRLEILGGRREAALTRLELAANALRAAIALTAGATRAFAIPLGYGAVGVVRWVGYVRLRRVVYGTRSAAGDELPAVHDQHLPRDVGQEGGQG